MEAVYFVVPIRALPELGFLQPSGCAEIYAEICGVLYGDGVGFSRPSGRVGICVGIYDGVGDEFS